MDQSFAVVLPLKKKARLEIGEVITELRLLVEQTGATIRIDPRMVNKIGANSRGGLFSLRSQPCELMQFELDGVRMRISQVPDPFADRLEMGRYVNPVMWEAGLGEFTDHRAHIKVYEAGIEGEEGPDATFDRAAAVTATASVVARLTEPVGAIWLTARNSVPVPRFAAALEQLMAGSAPLGFWLRWHVIPPGDMEDAASGLITGGLQAFVGHEILARPSKTETRVMIDHAFELARRLIDEKMTVTDNQTVESIAGSVLRLRLGTRFRSGETPICEIALASDGSGQRAGARPRSGQPPTDPAALVAAAEGQPAADGDHALPPDFAPAPGEPGFVHPLAGPMPGAPGLAGMPPGLAAMPPGLAGMPSSEPLPALAPPPPPSAVGEGVGGPAEPRSADGPWQDGASEPESDAEPARQAGGTRRRIRLVTGTRNGG